MSSDPSKPDPAKGFPDNVLSSDDVSNIMQIFKPRGGGWVVLGNVSDSITACSKANAGAYVNESTAAISSLSMYFCGGVRSEDEVNAIWKQYQDLPAQNYSNGQPAWYLLHYATAASGATAQHLGAWWWVPLMGSVALAFIST